VSERGNGGGEGQPWWRHHDGRWYPPELARHPAARGTAAGPREGGTADPLVLDLRLERAGGREWLLWATVLVPLLLLAGIVAALLGLTTGTRLGRAETAADPVRDTVTTESTTTSPATTVPTTPPATTPPAAAPPSTAGPTSSSASTPDVPAGSDGEGGQGGPSQAPSAAPAEPADVPAQERPQVPESADECKHGGWAELVDGGGQPFANQGDCVAYVSVRWS
jgi:hypothetical protein